MAHKWGDIYFDDINWEKTEYNSSKAYGQSKLANILFSKELAKRLQGTGVAAYSLHPGVIATDLGRHIEDSLGKFSFVFRLEFDNFDVDVHCTSFSQNYYWSLLLVESTFTLETQLRL